MKKKKLILLLENHRCRRLPKKTKGKLRLNLINKIKRKKLRRKNQDRRYKKWKFNRSMNSYKWSSLNTIIMTANNPKRKISTLKVLKNSQSFKNYRSQSWNKRIKRYKHHQQNIRKKQSLNKTLEQIMLKSINISKSHHWKNN